MADVAHIKGDAPQSAEDCRAYDNLILLCKVHHKFVDDDPRSYTVERLREMKRDHESTALKLTDPDVQEGAQVVMNGDMQITANNPVNSVVAHFYQHNVHNYGLEGAIPSSNGFVSAIAQDGNARFRRPNEKLGNLKTHPFVESRIKQVFMKTGPTFWFRLFPQEQQSKTWTFNELGRAVIASGKLLLHTMLCTGQYELTALDGIGYCDLSKR